MNIHVVGSAAGDGSYLSPPPTLRYDLYSFEIELLNHAQEPAHTDECIWLSDTCEGFIRVYSLFEFSVTYLDLKPTPLRGNGISLYLNHSIDKNECYNLGQFNEPLGISTRVIVKPTSIRCEPFDVERIVRILSGSDLKILQKTSTFRECHGGVVDFQFGDFHVFGDAKLGKEEVTQIYSMRVIYD